MEKIPKLTDGPRGHRALFPELDTFYFSLFSKGFSVLKLMLSLFDIKIP